MRLCSSVILASLSSAGGGNWPNEMLPLEIGVGRLPLVSHIIRTINMASPRMSHDCTFFGSRPEGLGALSWIGSFMMVWLLSVRTPRKRELLGADGEVCAIENFRNDVHTVL